jgi:hypothetical protein
MSSQLNKHAGERSLPLAGERPEAGLPGNDGLPKDWRARAGQVGNHIAGYRRFTSARP